MNMIIQKVNFSPDPKKIAEKYSVQKDDPLYDEIVNACKEAAQLGKPVVCYKQATVDKRGEDYVIIDGVKFSGKFISDRLKGQKKVYPFIASCGPELDKWKRNCSDIMLSYCLDDIRQSAIKPALSILREKLDEDYNVCKLSVVNPGSIQKWPVSEQKQLFKLMGPVFEKIGVRLDDSMLMYPLKSVSGIYFEDESGYSNCKICSRENCPNRKDEYDEEEMMKMLNL